MGYPANTLYTVLYIHVSVGMGGISVHATSFLQAAQSV